MFGTERRRSSLDDTRASMIRRCSGRTCIDFCLMMCDSDRFIARMLIFTVTYRKRELMSHRKRTRVRIFRRIVIIALNFDDELSHQRDRLAGMKNDMG